MNTKMTLDEPGRQSMNLPRKTPGRTDRLPTPSDIPDAFTEHFSTILPKLASEITSPTNGHKSCLEYLNITDNV